MTKKINRVLNSKILLIIVFAFALFMMLHNLTHSALWGDEWTEFEFSINSIRTGDMYNKIISTYQPPLYNFLMHFWLKISSTVLWFRLFNVIIGMISLFYLYKSLNQLFSSKIKIFIPIIVLSTCYSWIYCIQECSEYEIMLCFVFAALYHFILLSKGFNKKDFCLFVIMCVLAIYSQYGSVFVVLPMLGIVFIRNIIKGKIKDKLFVVCSYFLSFVTFAIPLLRYFLIPQMKGNEIAEHTVRLTADLFGEVLVKPGHILAYFFGMNNCEEIKFIYSLVGFLLLVMAVYLLIKKEVSLTTKFLMLVFLICYLTHYVLVVLQIYAMLHPGESAGFLCRYSYFYIPLFSIILPIIAEQLIELNDLRTEDARKTGQITAENFAYICQSRQHITRICILIFVVFNAISSFITVWPNWNKALDDEYARIWIENDGWEDVTYLFGVAEPGFKYYISHDKNYSDGMLSNFERWPQIEKMAPRFWIWRSNWGGDDWRGYVNRAEELGYTITEYDNSHLGQLIHCTYNGEISDLNAEDIKLHVIGGEFLENGNIRVSLQFMNSLDNKYNKENYMFSYHLYNENNELVQWDFARTEVPGIIQSNVIEIEVDISEFDLKEYYVEFDVLDDDVGWGNDLGVERPKIRVSGNFIEV